MKTRIEHDLLGEKEVPADAYYGIQTLRGIENFQNISGITIGDYPNYVKALAMVKWAAAKANQELEILPDDIANAITRAYRRQTPRSVPGRSDPGRSRYFYQYEYQ